VILIVAMFALPSGVAGFFRDRAVARQREALR
jgi:hypothetical protein